MSLSLYRLIIKAIPSTSRSTLRPQIIKAITNMNLSQSQFTAMKDYFTTLKIHDEYLQFFGVAQVQNDKQKLKNVGKFVGLQLPKIFRGNEQ